MNTLQGDQKNEESKRVLQDILYNGVKEDASDIHFEPTKEGFIVRYRIDGVLKIVHEGDRALFGHILAKIKARAQIEITGIPKPQEGDFMFKYENRDIDMRLSILPTSMGQCAVIRILANLNLISDFKELGLDNEQIKILKRNISRPNGLILVTGPNGSGKSTTLFSILTNLNTPEKSIVTLEDPVERKMRRIRQTGINAKVGLGFAEGLRYLLRQDPDIIMVGEIRDAETAKISVQAAITGHLVLATVHTNNAAGAIIRLIDMGVEPYMISSSLRLVTAQRLFRINCPHCKNKYEPPMGLLKALGAKEGTKFYHSIGCDECGQTGTGGREGIHELLEVDKEIQELILDRPNDDHIIKAALKDGMKTLRQRALEKVYDGTISIEEALRLVM